MKAELQVEYLFDGLLEYLMINTKLDHGIIAGIVVQHSTEQDETNQEDPRAFCHVLQDDSGVIYFTTALANLPLRNQVGVLLHEIGHIYGGFYGGQAEEVEVDAWVLQNVPGSGYTYETEVRYTSPWTKREVIAKNLESVSELFAEKIWEHAHG